jgi:serine/threonine protein kinase
MAASISASAQNKPGASQPPLPAPEEAAAVVLVPPLGPLLSALPVPPLSPVPPAPKDIKIRLAECVVGSKENAIVTFGNRTLTLGDQLGKGKYGAVMNATLDAGTPEAKAVAVKVTHPLDKKNDEKDTKEKRDTQQQRSQRELGILNGLSQLKGHPGSEALLSGTSAQKVITVDDQFILPMELVEGCCELYDKIVREGPLSEASAQTLFRQLALALRLLHQFGITHCDLKPANILYIKQNHGVKLVDFGFARFDTEKDDRIWVGTRQYAPPEIIFKMTIPLQTEPHDGRKSDVWSLAAVLYSMLTSSFLVGGSLEKISQQFQSFYSVREHDYHPLSLPSQIRSIEGLSKAGKNLLCKMLQMEAGKRLTAAEILEHQWVTPTPVRPSLKSSSSSKSPQDAKSVSKELSEESSDSED